MPIYVYACDRCGAESEVFVRHIGDEQTPACGRCGASDVHRVITQFGVARDLASELASLDPSYRKRIDDAIAHTPEADPMRLLSKMTPFSAAESPGDPVDF